jgi:hypothetical protein
LARVSARHPEMSLLRKSVKIRVGTFWVMTLCGPVALKREAVYLKFLVPNTELDP